jgi:uncharacterized membrane protein YbhN (UPF0104 family)
VIPSTSAAESTGRGRRIVWLKVAVFLVVVWFVGRTLRRAVDDLTKADWQFDGLRAALSGGIYLAGLSLAGAYWWWLLRKFGQPVNLLDAMRAYFAGHLGKYVPGKAMVLVVRAGIAKSSGADVALATAAVIIETLTMMACGAAVAFLLIVALVPPDWKLALAAALAVVTGGPTLPPLFNRLLQRMHGRRARKSRDPRDPAMAGTDEAAPSHTSPAHAAATIDWRTVWLGWGAMLVLWALLGLSLATLAGGLQTASPLGLKQYLLTVAAVALATVAGFLSLLPGGLVVRELILLDLMAPAVGEATALVAAVLLRLVWLATELAASGALYLWTGIGRRMAKTPRT